MPFKARGPVVMPHRVSAYSHEALSRAPTTCLQIALGQF